MECASASANEGLVVRVDAKRDKGRRTARDEFLVLGNISEAAQYFIILSHTDDARSIGQFAR